MTEIRDPSDLKPRSREIQYTVDAILTKYNGGIEPLESWLESDVELMIGVLCAEMARRMIETP